MADNIMWLVDSAFTSTYEANGIDSCYPLIFISYLFFPTFCGSYFTRGYYLWAKTKVNEGKTSYKNTGVVGFVNRYPVLTTRRTMVIIYVGFVAFWMICCIGVVFHQTLPSPFTS